MGNIYPGKPYGSNEVIFLVTFDGELSAMKQQAIIAALSKASTAAPTRLLPSSFVFQANVSAGVSREMAVRASASTATAVFRASLNNRDLTRGLRLMAEKLVLLHAMDSMPELPNPVRTR